MFTNQDPSSSNAYKQKSDRENFLISTGIIDVLFEYMKGSIEENEIVQFSLANEFAFTGNLDSVTLKRNSLDRPFSRDPIQDIFVFNSTLSFEEINKPYITRFKSLFIQVSQEYKALFGLNLTYYDLLRLLCVKSRKEVILDGPFKGYIIETYNAWNMVEIIYLRIRKPYTIMSWISWVKETGISFYEKL